MTADSPLTWRQLRFCAEYVADNNGTAAAIRAGYSGSSAKQQSSRLLTKANVIAEISRRQTQVMDIAEVTAVDITNRAWEIAQQDKPDRVAALALLARRHPEFSEKHELRSESIAIVFDMGKET